MRLGNKKTNPSVKLGPPELEQLGQFKYLGTILASNDVACLLGKAGAIFKLATYFNKPNYWSWDDYPYIHLSNTIVIQRGDVRTRDREVVCEIQRSVNAAQQKWLRRILEVTY